MKKSTKLTTTAKVTPGNRCCVWDLTIHDNQICMIDPIKGPAKEPYFTDEMIQYIDEQVLHLRNVFNEISKKYSFQLERGEKTGAYHFQCRISLKMKDIMIGLKELLNSHGIIKLHLSPTSTENRTNDFYVVKKETRVLDFGPYTDENYVYVPRDVRSMIKLFPWQESLRMQLSIYEPRCIDVLIDIKGNNGKTQFCRYMAIHQDAQILPMCNDYKDTMRIAYDVGVHPIYMIDIPRGIKQTNLSGLYSAIESLKGGYAFDDRNSFRQRYFDPPRVLVITNTVPDVRLLSLDRWRFWTINSKLVLKKYEFHPECRDESEESSDPFDSSSEVEI